MLRSKIFEMRLFFSKIPWICTQVSNFPILVNGGIFRFRSGFLNINKSKMEKFRAAGGPGIKNKENSYKLGREPNLKPQEPHITNINVMAQGLSKTTNKFFFLKVPCL